MARKPTSTAETRARGLVYVRDDCHHVAKARPRMSGVRFSIRQVERRMVQDMLEAAVLARRWSSISCLVEKRGGSCGESRLGGRPRSLDARTKWVILLTTAQSMTALARAISVRAVHFESKDCPASNTP